MVPYGKFLCDPSQRGEFPVCLQPQNDMVPASAASNFKGENADPLCEPSQNGCLPLLPQAHHQYDFPASTSILYEPFCATNADSDMTLPSGISCAADPAHPPQQRNRSAAFRKGRPICVSNPARLPPRAAANDPAAPGTHVPLDVTVGNLPFSENKITLPSVPLDRGRKMYRTSLIMSLFRLPGLALALTGALGAPLACADAGPHDGLYSGTGATTYGSQPVCGAGGPMSITVQDSKIDYKFGEFPIKSVIATDGHFRAVTHIGKKARRTMRTRGTISNAMLEADLTSRDFTGHLCSYHWSLHKQ
jgi:hypothetical protein